MCSCTVPVTFEALHGVDTVDLAESGWLGGPQDRGRARPRHGPPAITRVEVLAQNMFEFVWAVGHLDGERGVSSPRQLTKQLQRDDAPAAGRAAADDHRCLRVVGSWPLGSMASATSGRSIRRTVRLFVSPAERKVTLAYR
jgi:hypothetical protein